MSRPAKLTRDKLVELYQSLDHAKAHLPEVRHRWIVLAMRRSLRDAVEIIIEERDAVVKLAPKEYEEARRELCQSMAAKDSKGEPVLAGGHFIIDPARRSEFDASLAALRKKHAKQIADFEEQVAKLNAGLQEKVDLPAIPQDNLKLSWFAKGFECPDILYDFVDADLA